MTTYETSVWGDSRVDIIRILVLVEAAIASVMVIEALAAIAFSGPAAAPLVLAAVIAAAGTLWLVQSIGRRSKRARKFAIWLQVGILIVAALDLLLAILLAQRSLELVPTFTRVVLPLTVFRPAVAVRDLPHRIDLNPGDQRDDSCLDSARSPRALRRPG